MYHVSSLGSQTSIAVGGLAPDKDYQFQVAAYTRRGDGHRTRPKKIRTKAAGILWLHISVHGVFSADLSDDFALHVVTFFAFVFPLSLHVRFYSVGLLLLLFQHPEIFSLP